MRTLQSLAALASALLIGAVASPAARASVVYTNSSTISGVLSFTQYGSGDVIVKLTSSGQSGCSFGFWIRATDGGAKGTLAQILAAYHTGAPVVIGADPAIPWPGNTSSTACLVWSVQS